MKTLHSTFMFLVTDSRGTHALYSDEDNAFTLYERLCENSRNHWIDIFTKYHALEQDKQSLEYLNDHPFYEKSQRKELDRTGKATYTLKLGINTYEWSIEELIVEDEEI